MGVILNGNKTGVGVVFTGRDGIFIFTVVRDWGGIGFFCGMGRE